MEDRAQFPRHHRDGLMHRERLTEELAFTLLVSTSQKANTTTSPSG